MTWQVNRYRVSREKYLVLKRKLGYCFYVVPYFLLTHHRHYHQSVNPILIWVYPRKRGWLDFPHSNNNLSNSHSLCRSIQGILLLQTNTLALLFHLRLPRLLWLSSLPLALHLTITITVKTILNTITISVNNDILTVAKNTQHFPPPILTIFTCHFPQRSVVATYNPIYHHKFHQYHVPQDRSFMRRHSRDAVASSIELISISSKAGVPRDLQPVRSSSLLEAAHDVGGISVFIYFFAKVQYFH